LRIKFAPLDGSGAMRERRGSPGDFVATVCEPLHKRMPMLMAACGCKLPAADRPAAAAGRPAMRPTTFADFVIVALAVPCGVLVLSSYALLAAALIQNVRAKLKLATSGVRRHAPPGR
jgi:hypothetical protein